MPLGKEGNVEEQAIVLQGDELAMRDRPGVLAMAMLPEAEFQQRLAALKQGQERIRIIKRDLMQKGSHYGEIPGTDKPTLLKPGAEVLASIYGLRADFKPTADYGDGIVAPPIRVSMRCELHLGSLDGPVVAVGYGAANSWERKHRYRRAERTCPTCGVVGGVIKGKAEYGGGWLCWTKKGGCGAKFKEDDPAIVEQAVEDVENKDQHDLENTLLKMAEKRAFVDAALRGTASSDLFTQDVEDMDRDHEPDKPARAATKPSKPREQTKAAGNGEQMPVCPSCGSDDKVMLSKFPRRGKFYCGTCTVGFDFNASPSAEPGSEG